MNATATATSGSTARPSRRAAPRGGRKRVKLADGQAYCFHCRKAVNMVEVSTAKITSRYLEVVTGKCPECESKVSRGRARSGQS